MTRLRRLIEDLRDTLAHDNAQNAVDLEGAKGCYSDLVNDYAEKTGLPLDGLWSVVDGVLTGAKTEKLLRKLHKSWGGTPEQWIKFYATIREKPRC